jgi:BirA family biotin operon repressor/biotin-[acetyl-CoA-carboxylase] ligase
MDVCRALHAEGARDFSVVVADEQTAGRGRGDHRWHSPPGGGLYVSVLLYPRFPASCGAWLTMIGALAVLDAIHALWPPLRAISGLKWFNDVQLSGRKLAGVLVESAMLGDAFDYAILGIGLNASTHFDDAPDDVRARATSLQAHCADPIDHNALLDLLLGHLRRRYAQLHAGMSPRGDYADMLRTLGQPIAIRVGDAVLEGVAQDVDDDGALIVSNARGEHRVTAGLLLS